MFDAVWSELFVFDADLSRLLLVFDADLPRLLVLDVTDNWGFRYSRLFVLTKVEFGGCLLN